MTRIVIYTDGSTRRNPGPGGWAAVIHRPGSDTWEIVEGNEEHATNNAMEIRACIEGLKAISKKGADITVYTDSMYIVGTMTLGWRRRKNREAFEMLDQLCEDHHVEWRHVKGHDGHVHNETAHIHAHRQSGKALMALQHLSAKGWRE